MIDALATRRRAGLAGVVATVLALAVTELLAAVLPGGGSLVVAVGNAVIEGTPGPVVRFAIETFGGANRLVLLSSMAVGMLVAGGGLAIASLRRGVVAPIGFAVFAILGALAGIADGLAAGTALAATAGGAVAGVVLLRRLLALLRSGGVRTSGVDGTRDPGPADGPRDPDRPDPAQRPSRRRFLTWAASAAGAAGVLLATGRVLQQRTSTSVARRTTALPTPRHPLPDPPPDASLDVEGISELFTPTEEFYRIDTAFTIPRVDPGSHRIAFTGMVDHPFELTFDELLDLADTEVDVTLSCVSNEIGGDLVGNARWLGVPLARLLDRAGVQAQADQIVGRSVDGWTGGFPVEAAFDGRPAIVAVGMNGQPLPARHGFPARLVIAGLYGYVSDTKWLAEVELTTFEAFDAYWVPRGWSERGPIKTQSRIDVPRAGASIPAGTVAIGGVAWSDERGVSNVEVAIDDGPWRAAELAAELATTSWRQWVHRWEATPGEHVLRVRASDADGRPQTADVAPPAPDGATGHHTVLVQVT